MFYKCRILTDDYKIINEVIETESEEELFLELKNKNYKLINCKQIKKHNKSKEKHLSDNELSNFCNQMYFVFSSNTNILQGLSIINEGMSKKDKMNEIISKIYRDVECGNSLSYSMKSMGNTFPSMLTGMVESGELSGNLSSIFEKMDNYYKKQSDIKSKVKMMLIQPIFLMTIAFFMMIFFLYYILPDIMNSLDVEKEQLPQLTKLVLNFADFTKNNYILIIISFIVLIISIRYLYKKEKVKTYMHKLFVKIPIVGSTIIYMETYKLSTTLELFVKSGVTLLDGIETTFNVVNNRMAKTSIIESKKSLLEGNKFSTGLSKGEFFDYLFIKTIEIGEETGSMDDALERMSSIYSKKVDLNIKKLLALLEPLLIVFIGCFVLILVLSIALPIFTMMDFVSM